MATLKEIGEAVVETGRGMWTTLRSMMEKPVTDLPSNLNLTFFERSIRSAGC